MDSSSQVSEHLDDGARERQERERAVLEKDELLLLLLQSVACLLRPLFLGVSRLGACYFVRAQVRHDMTWHDMGMGMGIQARPT